jgi:hypothetical protein
MIYYIQFYFIIIIIIIIIILLRCHFLSLYSLERDMQTVAREPRATYLRLHCDCDLISETWNKNIWNSANNDFNRVYTETLFRNTLYYL